jgi:hypothetical protein
MVLVFIKADEAIWFERRRKNHLIHWLVALMRMPLGDCFAPSPRSTRGQAVARNDIYFIFPKPVWD